MTDFLGTLFLTGAVLLQGLTFTTEYEYDLAGILKKITLPSGRAIDYALNANGQVASVAADVNGRNMAGTLFFAHGFLVSPVAETPEDSFT